METTKFLGPKYYRKVNISDESDDGDDIPSSNDIHLAQLSGRIKTLTRLCALLLLLLASAVVLLVAHIFVRGPSAGSCQSTPNSQPNPAQSDIDQVLRISAPQCE